MHEWACFHDEAANHQLPIAATFWTIWIVSIEECSSLMHNLMRICCSTCSVILNVTATQYTCSFNSVYCPHWLVQWNHHCPLMSIPVHSPWLPGYVNVVLTVLFILTITGIFVDKPHFIISVLFSYRRGSISHIVFVVHFLTCLYSVNQSILFHGDLIHFYSYTVLHLMYVPQFIQLLSNV